MGIIKEVFNAKTRSLKRECGGFSFGETAGTGSKKCSGEGKNCELQDGVLTTGVGLGIYRMENGDELPLAANLPAADSFFYVYEKADEGDGYSKRLGFLSAAGSAYIYDFALDAFALWHTFGGRMKTVLAMDEAETPVTLFVGEAGVFAYANEGVLATEIVEASPIACTFKDRVFCVDAPFNVRYSALLSPTDFSEKIDGGGRFCFPSEAGEIVGLLPFQEKIFVLYERGLSSFLAAGAPRDFRLEKIEYGGGKIFGSSAGVCSVGGEKAFFLAEDGLYRFDGEKVKKICLGLNISPLRGGQVCVHAEFEGKYFLVFTDKNGEKRAIVVDAESEEGYYAFAPESVGQAGGQALCALQNKVRFLCLDGDLPSGEEYVFLAKGLDFETDGVKTLKALSFTGEGAFTLTVSNGRTEKTCVVAFDGGRANVAIGLKGEIFSLKFVLEKGARVQKTEALLVKLDGVK